MFSWNCFPNGRLFKVAVYCLNLSIIPVNKKSAEPKNSRFCVVSRIFRLFRHGKNILARELGILEENFIIKLVENI